MKKEIRTQIIDSIILSPEIKNYWKSIDYDITDFQWLNLIIHNYKNINNLKQTLMLLSQNTKYKRLKNLIWKLIKTQHNAFDDISMNDGNYIYMIYGYSTDYANSMLKEKLGCVKYFHEATSIIKKSVCKRYDTIRVKKIKLSTIKQKRYSLFLNTVGIIEFDDHQNVINCYTDTYNFYKIVSHTNYDINVFIPHQFKYRDKIIDLVTKRTGTIISSTNNKSWYQDFEYEDTCFNIKFDNKDQNEFINILSLTLRRK